MITKDDKRDKRLLSIISIALVLVAIFQLIGGDPEFLVWLVTTIIFLCTLYFVKSRQLYKDLQSKASKDRNKWAILFRALIILALSGFMFLLFYISKILLERVF